MPREEKRQDGNGDPLLVPKILLLVEVAAALIAVAITVVPSKTGSDWSFAELLWDSPSFLQKVVAAFVATNALLCCLGIVAYFVHRAHSGKVSAKP